MTVWRTVSNAAAQTTAAVISALCGLVMSWLAWNVAESSVGVLAARGLGAALILVGGALLAWGGRQVVTVDTRQRSVRIESRGRFGSSARTIRFAEIADVQVAELGDREGGAPSYHLVITLRDGRDVGVFTGFFDGRHLRAAMEARRQKLLACLGSRG